MKASNFTALIYLKNQSRKWKNIAIATFIILFITIFIQQLSPESKTNIEIGKSYIASIKIEGVIDENDYGTKILERISTQKNIKALIVNINSPGGTIVGSEILYQNLRDIAKRKPVVTVMGSMAASGGYMAATAADYIIARNGTLTGSIGVMMQSGEITDLAKKLGIKFQTYKSSPIKGSPSPFEKSTLEVDKIMNDSIQDSHKFFSDLVLTRRKGKIKQVKKVTDGRIFTGRQALKAGLIDEIGGKKEALKYLKEVRKIKTKEIQEISITKVSNNWLEKIIGDDQLSGLKGIISTNNNGLMAIFGH